MSRAPWSGPFAHEPGPFTGTVAVPGVAEGPVEAEIVPERSVRRCASCAGALTVGERMFYFLEGIDSPPICRTCLARGNSLSSAAPTTHRGPAIVPEFARAAAPVGDGAAEDRTPEALRLAADLERTPFPAAGPPPPTKPTRLWSSDVDEMFHEVLERARTIAAQSRPGTLGPDSSLSPDEIPSNEGSGSA